MEIMAHRMFLAVLLIGCMFLVPFGPIMSVMADTINNTDPANGDVINGNYVFRVDDDGGAYRCELYIDNRLVAFMDTGAGGWDWQYTVNTSAWNDGVHKIGFYSRGAGDDAVTVAVTFDNNPPIVDNVSITYPGVQTAAKNGDSIYIVARITDTTTGVASVTLDASSIGAGTVTMYDDGLHLDGIAGDGYYGTGMLVVNRSSSAYCTLNLTTQDGKGNTGVTPVRVDVDLDEPTVSGIKKEYPPGQTAVKFGDKIRILAKSVDYHIEIVKELRHVPVDVTLTLDTSGSMSGQPWNDLKVAAKGFIDRLNDTDRVAIYGFENSYPYESPQRYLDFVEMGKNYNCPYCAFSGSGRSLAKHIIDNHMSPNAYTPIWDTIGEAVTYTINNVASGHLPVVVVMTDGDDYGRGWGGRERGSETYCPGAPYGSHSEPWPNPSPPAAPITGETWGKASGNVWGDTPRYYDGIWRYTTSGWTSINLPSSPDHEHRTGLLNISIPVFTIGLGIAPQGSNSSAANYINPTDPKYNYTTEYDLRQIANTSNGGRYYYAPSSSDLDTIYQNISQVIVNTSVNIVGLTTPHGVAKLTADLSELGIIGEVQLYDDGKHGDGVAGDDLYGSDWVTVNTWDTGMKFIKVTATDIAGNTNFSTSLISVDNMRPDVYNITINYPSGKNYVEDGDYVTVTANVSDNGTVHGIFMVSIDASPIGGNSGVLMYDDGNHNDGASGDGLYGTPKILVKSGNKENWYATLSITAWDNAFNPYRVAATLLVNNRAPNVQPVTPLNGEYVRGTITLTIDASDSHGIPDTNTNPQYRIDGGVWKDMVQQAPGMNRYLAQLNTQTLRDGTHVIEYRVEDGNKMVTTTEITVHVDNRNPVCNIMNPSPSENIKGRYVFKVRAYDNIGIDRVELIFGGAVGGTVPCVYNSAGGTYEYYLDTTIYGDATGTVSARVYDKAGNSYITAVVPFNMDNSPPQIGMVSPHNYGYISGQCNLQINVFEFYAPTVDYKVDAGTWIPMNLGGAAPNHVCTAVLNTATLQDGGHMLTFRAIDPIGHVTEMSIWVYVDNNAAVGAIMAPLPGQYINGAYTFRVLAKDVNGIKSVSMKISSLKGEIPMEYNPATGYYEFTLDTSILPDGKYTLTVNISEISGVHANTIIALPSPGFYIDNNAPSLSILSPHNGQFVEGMFDIDVQTDDVFIDKVQYRVDDGPWYDIMDGKEWDTSSYDDGKHIITIRATDLAGHEVSRSVIVYVDNSAPTCHIIMPIEHEYVSELCTVRISAWDALGVEKVLLKLGEKEISMPYRADTGYYEYMFYTDDMDDGEYIINVTVYDSIGHTATESLTFYIDNHAPTLYITYPSNGDYINGTVSIEYTADDVFLSEVSYSIDNRDFVSISETLNTEDYDEGIHKIAIRAKDYAGHEVVKSISVIFDNSAPLVNIVSPVDEYINGYVPVRVTAMDNVSPVSVIMTIDDMSVSMEFNAGSGYYEYILDTSAFPDGEYTISVIGNDIIGYSTSDEIKVCIDNNLPNIKIISPYENEIINGTVTIDVNATDVFLKDVMYCVDGKNYVSISEPLNTTEFIDGVHVIEIVAEDYVGHKSTVRLTIIIDNAYPKLTPYSIPENGTTVTGEIKIIVDVRDDNEIDRVRAYLSNASNEGIVAVEMVLNDATGMYECIIDTTEINDGEAFLKVVAKDREGHESLIERSIKVDNSPPESKTVKIIGREGDIKIRIETSDLSRIEFVKISIDGKEYADMKEIKNNLWEYVWSTDRQDNGDHTINISMSDEFGHISYAEGKFTVSNPDPSWGVVATVILALIVFGILYYMHTSGMLTRRRIEEKKETLPEVDDEEYRYEVPPPPMEEKTLEEISAEVEGEPTEIEQKPLNEEKKEKETSLLNEIVSSLEDKKSEYEHPPHDDEINHHQAKKR